MMRRGLRALLESQPGLEVCCEAANGAEALDYAKKSKPDLAILDLTMPEMNGLEAARSIRQESPSTEVLVLTMHFADELAREVLRSGALGYILKTDADTELIVAVEHMRRHQPFFTARLAVSLAQNFAAQPSAEADGEGGEGAEAGSESPLTDREIEVVRLLAEGKSNKETAAALGVSSRTIESHRNHVMRKMEFTSFSDLVRFAVRSNLVEP
jgi:DNA-binding NarL/FixJ family response regulator